jgi:hypothetical protein
VTKLKNYVFYVYTYIYDIFLFIYIYTYFLCITINHEKIVQLFTDGYKIAKELLNFGYKVKATAATSTVKTFLIVSWVCADIFVCN